MCEDLTREWRGGGNEGSDCPFSLSPFFIENGSQVIIKPEEEEEIS